MLKLVAISIAALAASSAFAQVADPSAASPAPSSAPTQQQPATADPAAPAQPGTTAGPSAAPAAASSPVAAVVESGFATYDKDKSGALSGPEFKQWIADLKTQEQTSEGKKADPAAAKQYAATALKAADKNKDGKVTKEELTAFLSG